MCMSAIVQTHVLVYAILLHHAILNRNQLALIAGSHAYNIDFKTLLMCTLIALLVDTIGVLPDQFVLPMCTLIALLVDTIGVLPDQFVLLILHFGKLRQCKLVPSAQ